MPTTKRACDACHRRKIKCDGGNPCKNCSQASLTCTFNAVPLKKGPKGSRAKVISELREKQQSEVQWTLKMQKQLEDPSLAFQWSRTPGVLSREVVDSCIDFFFTHMYATMPVLNRSQLLEEVEGMDQSPDTYCLVASLCAFMSIQPAIQLPAYDSGGSVEEPFGSLTMGTTLLEEVLRVRKSYEFVENPSSTTVITSFFIFACYFSLDKHNTAWFHLREATTLAQILGLHEEESYSLLESEEASRRRRLFWLLFVTERAYALQRHRPLTLKATIDLPTLQDDPSNTTALSGFLHMVQLFRPFDDVFITLWNKTSPFSTLLDTAFIPTKAGAPTRAWLAHLQHELAMAFPLSNTSDSSTSGEAQLQATPTQAADLLTSQHWLRTMVWQLSISAGYLSSSSPDPVLTFTYPLNITHDLLASTASLDRQTMEVHGVGLVEKLFDIACTATDVLSCAARARGFRGLSGQAGWTNQGLLGSGSWALGGHDSLSQLFYRIGSLRGGNTRYLPLLQKKIAETLPEMGWPMPQSTSVSTDSSRNQSPSRLQEEQTRSTLAVEQHDTGLHHPTMTAPNDLGPAAADPSLIKSEAIVSSALEVPRDPSDQELQTSLLSPSSNPSWLWTTAPPAAAMNTLLQGFDERVPANPVDGKQPWFPR